MSLFYTGIRFTSGQIGAINAGVALASMAFQPVWGTLGDRVKDRRLLLAGLAAASAASVFAYRRFTGFAPLLLLACLFACFYTSLQPMGDSIILKDWNASSHGRRCPTRRRKERGNEEVDFCKVG